MVDRSWSLLFYFVVLFFLSFPLSYAGALLAEYGDSFLEKDKAGGLRIAGRLLLLTEHRERTTAVLRTGLTISISLEFILLSAAFFSLPQRLAAYFGAEGGVLFLLRAGCYLLLLAVFGGLHLLVGEFIPAMLGRRRAASARPYRGAWLLPLFNAVFGPFYKVFSACARGILFLMGYREQKTPAVTEEEIRDLVDRGEESGGIERGEKEMIDNVFEFTDLTVGEVMTHRTDVTAIDAAADDAEICRIIRESGYSRFPVFEEDIDSVKGILSARTFLLDRVSGSGRKTPLEKLCYTPYFVPETKHADDLLQEMKKSKLHMAVVIDEYGGTLGIVTMEDLLEEIVGSIYDETDDPLSEEELVPLGGGVFRAAGTLSPDRIEEALGVDLENEDCDTLGGLVFSRVTLIPEDGSTPVLDIGPLHVEVEEIKNRRVEWARISRLSKEESAADGD